ncbi:hypothetical protein [Gloeothece verrucosa]|uniref:Uncharacterized protein n=1 Tax=Gloeothece verrucosa (strain PCC 7822) TaxID=497965 RepID=E0UET3_GLOV7|nr:hypothetical protein [Gloeothece verrucosa]ADN13063.1 hypothetical protein Cyan7822_1054 [Gloeothece verrucosa PCC 7822]
MSQTNPKNRIMSFIISEKELEKLQEIANNKKYKGKYSTYFREIFINFLETA